MTEKRYCGGCNYLRKGIRYGLPQFYCPIIEKNVSFIDVTCPNFTEKVVSDNMEERRQILKALTHMPYLKYSSDDYKDVKKELAHDRAKNCAD